MLWRSTRPVGELVVHVCLFPPQFSFGLGQPGQCSLGSVSEFVILLPTGFEPPHRELNPCNNSNEEYLHDDSWTHGFDIAHRAARFSESLGLLGGEEASRLGKSYFARNFARNSSARIHDPG